MVVTGGRTGSGGCGRTATIRPARGGTGVSGDVRSRLDGALTLVFLFGLARTFFSLVWACTSFLVNACSGRGSWIESQLFLFGWCVIVG